MLSGARNAGMWSKMTAEQHALACVDWKSNHFSENGSPTAAQVEQLGKALRVDDFKRTWDIVAGRNFNAQGQKRKSGQAAAARTKAARSGAGAAGAGGSASARAPPATSSSSDEEDDEEEEEEGEV
jgi:hypothetical protein